MVSKKIYVFKWVKLPWQNEFCFSQIAIKKKEIGKVHLRTRGIPLLTNLFSKLVCFLQKENRGSPVSVVSIKVENILKGSLLSIPSPSPSVKIQIMGGKVCLRCKGKTLLGIVTKLIIFKSLLTTSRAESFWRLKVSQGWKCLSTPGLKVSHGWNSQLKVSQGWKCLLESGLQVSLSWNSLGAESVF